LRAWRTSAARAAAHQATPEDKCRDDLAWALGYQKDSEPPNWTDLVNQVRQSRTVREERERDAWAHVNDAIAALEKHWPALNLHQQWSARQRLRDFAKSIPKVEEKDLPSTGHW
jgi:hypothetical protein